MKRDRECTKRARVSVDYALLAADSDVGGPMFHAHADDLRDWEEGDSDDEDYTKRFFMFVTGAGSMRAQEDAAEEEKAHEDPAPTQSQLRRARKKSSQQLTAQKTAQDAQKIVSEKQLEEAKIGRKMLKVAKDMEINMAPSGVSADRNFLQGDVRLALGFDVFHVRLISHAVQVFM